MGWGPTAFTPRYFRSRNFYIWSMWGLRCRSRGYMAAFSVSPACLCCDLRDVTNSELFGVLAPVSSYPSVAQCLVINAAVAPSCLIVPSSFLVSLDLGCLGLCLYTHFYLLPSRVLRVPSLVPHLPPQHCCVLQNIIMSIWAKGFYTVPVLFSFPRTVSMVGLFAWIPISLSF